MPRYVAFLRGVMPTNCKMPALRACFEAAGFAEVKTLLASGNVVFTAKSAPLAALERRAERAMESQLGRVFGTFVRPADFLRELLDSDPFARFAVPDGAKRVVTFLREPPDPAPALPVERSGACIHGVAGAEAFASYLPSPEGPVFMTLLERTFGKDVTTRTLETVRRCVEA